MVPQQGDCGAGWTFSAAGTASDSLCIQSGGTTPAILSPMHIGTCCAACTESMCSGGSPYQSLEFFKSTGVVDGTDVTNEYVSGYGQGCYPYSTAGQDTCQNTACSSGNGAVFDSVRHGQENNLIVYSISADLAQEYIQKYTTVLNIH